MRVNAVVGRNLWDITCGKDHGNIAISNRFGNLGQGIEVVESTRNAIISRANKENAIIDN